MNRCWLRLVPVVLVGALLALALIAPSRRAGARPAPPPAASAVVYANCDIALQRGPIGGAYPCSLGLGDGVTQLLATTGNVSACSLYVPPNTYSTGRMDVVQWDPLGLAPDPTTVALRSASFTISNLQLGQDRAIWIPPLVQLQVDHLAEPPKAQVAINYENNFTPYNADQKTYFRDDGLVGIPAAYHYDAGGPRVLLPGVDPVMCHGVCGGDSTLQALRLVQSVMTTSGFMGTMWYDIVQPFRVPVETKLHWVELAFGTVPITWGMPPGSISILDAGASGWAAPPSVLPAPLVTGLLSTGGWLRPQWDSHADFGQVITLEPDHDYWLQLHAINEYGVYTRLRNGTESADYVSAIGPVFGRVEATTGWNIDPTMTLCFRLVGEPTGVTSVPPGTAAPRRFDLGVAPNPTRGMALVRWSGASGSVRLEVIDARGRRVASGVAAGGASGAWVWRGIADDGRALPAGVYFVRATDGAGRRAAERVVVVR